MHYNYFNQDKLLFNAKMIGDPQESRYLCSGYLIRQGEFISFNTGPQTTFGKPSDNFLMKSGSCAQGSGLNPQQKLSVESPAATPRGCSENTSHQMFCFFASSCKRVLSLLTHSFSGSHIWASQQWQTDI